MVKISGDAGRVPQPSTIESTAEEKPTVEASPEVATSSDESDESSSSSTPTVQTAADARERGRRDVSVQQVRGDLDRQLDGAPDSEAVPPRRTSSPYARAFRLDEPSFEELRRSNQPPVEAASNPALAPAAFLPIVHASSAAPPPATDQFHANGDGTFTFRGNTTADDYVVKGDGSGGLIVEDGAGTVLDTLSPGDTAGGARIWAGGGNDNVTIDASVNVEIDVHAGPGMDTVDASSAGAAVTIAGGGGDDTITGSRFGDVILGGSGADTIHGRSGNDRIEGQLGDDIINGGNGRDQLLGGADDDTIDGGTNHDFIMGNDGNDTLRGGRGSDAIYANAGDTVHAGYQDAAGNETADGDDEMIVAENGVVATGLDGDDVVANYDPTELDSWRDPADWKDRVVIEGRDEFVEMVEADLAVMLGTAEGRALLDEVANGVTDAEPLRIREQDTPGGTYEDPSQVTAPDTEENLATVGMWSRVYGDGALRHPNPILNHEIVHARQDVMNDGAQGYSTWSAGGDARSRERQATGLSFTRLDLIAGGWVLEPANSYARTDNKYRAELGLKERETYSSEPAGTDPDGWQLNDPTP